MGSSTAERASKTSATAAGCSSSGSSGSVSSSVTSCTGLAARKRANRSSTVADAPAPSPLSIWSVDGSASGSSSPAYTEGDLIVVRFGFASDDGPHFLDSRQLGARRGVTQSRRDVLGHASRVHERARADGRARREAARPGRERRLGDA